VIGLPSAGDHTDMRKGFREVVAGRSQYAHTPLQAPAQPARGRTGRHLADHDAHAVPLNAIQQCPKSQGLLVEDASHFRSKSMVGTSTMSLTLAGEPSKKVIVLTQRKS
jgi:hypothetical protein